MWTLGYNWVAQRPNFESTKGRMLTPKQMNFRGVSNFMYKNQQLIFMYNNQSKHFKGQLWPRVTDVFPLFLPHPLPHLRGQLWPRVTDVFLLFLPHPTPPSQRSVVTPCYWRFSVIPAPSPSPISEVSCDRAIILMLISPTPQSWLDGNAIEHMNTIELKNQRV